MIHGDDYTERIIRRVYRAIVFNENPLQENGEPKTDEMIRDDLHKQFVCAEKEEDRITEEEFFLAYKAALILCSGE